MDILPIQGLAVPCENVFSSAKETTTARRNHISPNLCKCLNFTAGTARSAEIADLEALASDEKLVPEDTMAFIASLAAAA
jgi:hypothetical protein